MTPVLPNVRPLLSHSNQIEWSGWTDLADTAIADPARVMSGGDVEAESTLEAFLVDPAYRRPVLTVPDEQQQREIDEFAAWLDDEPPNGFSWAAIYRYDTAEETKTAVIVQCEPGELLTLSEVGAALKLHPETVRLITKTNDQTERLGSIRVGKVGVRVPCEELRTYLSRRYDEMRNGRPEPAPSPSTLPAPLAEVLVYSAPMQRRR